MIDVTIIPILKDNYAYLLRADNGQVGVVDPGEAEPVIQALQENCLNLDFILCTHHHGDHIGGNDELKIHYKGLRIIGPAREEKRIQMNIGLSEGDTFPFGSEEAEIIETPGHTKGGICFYFSQSGIIFTGDTLFSLGCGRLFEGTPEQMWQSFKKLMALPDETKVYPGHEYTQANGQFCLSIEPDNKDLQKRMEDVNGLRAAGKPTIPSTIGLEKKTNGFLRAGSASQFANLRKMKDAA